MKQIKIKKSPPYDFILEALGPAVTAIKPMFGAYGIYRNEKILMILRKKEKFDNDTGMWLALPDDFVVEVKNEIPELRDLEMFGTGPTAWQVLGEDLENFEEVALHICDLILAKDKRIGRTPKNKLKTKKKTVKKKAKKTSVKKKK